MPNSDASETGCCAIMMYDKSSPSKTDLKPGFNGTYYNSMDEFNRNPKNHDCQEKNYGNIEKSTFSAEVKTFKIRFVMLFLASFCSMMNGLPQFQYTVVADIVSCFYGVSLTAVNWTCVVYMVAFLPLVLPVMYFMDRKGLRKTVVIGGFLNFLGGWIQCGSFATDRYWVIMASQSIFAIGQVFLLSLPPFIAGVWFGAGEVGLACAFGVFGNQLGIALGFILPPLMIDNNCKHRWDISHELSIIGYSTAAINTVIFFILIIVFQEKPPACPSVAQAAKQNADQPNYVKSLKNLFKDVHFILLFLSYGLITGTYFAMSTIMNEMVLDHFPGEEMDAGWMGAIMVFAGMAGSIFLGTALDKTHQFKRISLATFCISFLLSVVYAGLIFVDNAIWIQFLFFALLGFVTAGYLPVGFDFAAEITYPESEAMSASLLNASCQIFSIIITIVSSELIQDYGDTASNIFFCACLLLGTITTACIKCELKRTHAVGMKPQ